MAAAVAVIAVLGGAAVAASAARQPRAVSDGAARSLAPSYGALFGAWVQPAGYSGSNAEQHAVAAFERTIGRPLAIDGLYVNWAGPMPLAAARWDLRQGSIPMISWSGTRTDRIAAGDYDAQIRARALQLKALPGPVMLRWFAEMDLPANQTDAVSPASFIAAWRLIHGIFASVGATNVRWVWCPDGSAFGTSVAQAYYPGSSYVDWVGADGYNWAPELPHAKWRSFAEIFSPFYQWGISTGKPLLVGEYGSVEGAPGAKAAWFRQADQQLRTKFQAIRAVVYFNSDHPAFGRYFNWRVTTSQSALAAFRAFAQDQYFSARPAV